MIGWDSFYCIYIYSFVHVSICFLSEKKSVRGVTMSYKYDDCITHDGIVNKISSISSRQQH